MLARVLEVVGDGDLGLLGTEFRFRKGKAQEMDDGESCATVRTYLMPLTLKYG